MNVTLFNTIFLNLAGKEGEQEDRDRQKHILGTTISEEWCRVDFCDHIPGEIKKIQQKVATKVIEDGMSEAQKVSFQMDFFAKQQSCKVS